jgi:hypothetical protein
VKLRTLFKKIRLRSLEGDGQRPIDNVDALASTPAAPLKGLDSGPGPTAPTNWVPADWAQDFGKPRK